MNTAFEKLSWCLVGGKRNEALIPIEGPVQLLKNLLRVAHSGSQQHWRPPSPRAISRGRRG